jgi:hypothetical protein
MIFTFEMGILRHIHSFKTKLLTDIPKETKKIGSHTLKSSPSFLPSSQAHFWPQATDSRTKKRLENLRGNDAQ